MIRALPVLFAFVLAGCVVGQGFSQGPVLEPAPLPSYKAGDSFRFDDGRVETVETVDPQTGQVTWRTGPTATSRRLASFVVPRLEWRAGERRGRFLSDDASNALWPLAPDSRQEFSGTLVEVGAGAGIGQGERLSFDCWVGATRTITVPAGTYETWRVNCFRRSTGTVRRSRLYSWYYAPAVGHYVRREIAGGFADISDIVELESWQRAAPGG